MKKALVSVIAVALVLLPTTGGTRTGYLEPTKWRGMVFPIARTDWYSVINFRDDWLAPRMRFEDGKWRQVGVHQGNDIFAEPGTPVRAVVGGTVENIGWLFYSGWRVGIRAPDDRYWFYAHLRRFAPGIVAGGRVTAGEQIGEVGNTGYGEDPGHDDEFTYHLHVGIQEPDGRWINPYPLMRQLYSKTVER